MFKNLLVISLLLFSVFAQASELESIEKIIQQAKVEQVDNPLPGTDPYQPFNRAMFKFNLAFHQHIGGPVAHAYLDYVPQPVQTGVSHFFDNLSTPIHSLNCFLQGKGEAGLSEIMRFALNTVFGLGGLLDIATPAGLKAHQEDFGQTLYVWGVWPESHYLVLPFVGPTTTRNLFGDVGDAYMDPIYQDSKTEISKNRSTLMVGNAFVSYTQYAPLMDSLKDQFDPYIFARESYFQYRKNQLYDGHPPTESLDDFNFE